MKGANKFLVSCSINQGPDTEAFKVKSQRRGRLAQLTQQGRTRAAACAGLHHQSHDVTREGRVKEASCPNTSEPRRRPRPHAPALLPLKTHTR